MQKLAHFRHHFLPIMAHYEVPILAELAETLFLFYRVTIDYIVPFQKTKNCTRYGYVNEI